MSTDTESSVPSIGAEPATNAAPAPVRTAAPAVLRPLAWILAAAVGYLVLAGVPNPPPGLPILLAILANVFAPLIAGRACWLHARDHPTLSRPARLFSACVSAWGLGSLVMIVTTMVLGRDLAFPSVSDGLYFGSLSLLMAGLLSIRFVTTSRRDRWAIGLDGLIVAGSLFCLAWPLVISSVYEDRPGNALSLTLGLAYPLSDLLLLSVVLLITGRSSVMRKPLLLLSAGAGLVCVSDLFFVLQVHSGGYTPGAPSDVGYLAGYVLIAVAAGRMGDGGARWAPSAVQRTAPALVPVLVVGVAVIGLAIDFASPGRPDRILWAAACGLGGLVVIRQVAFTLENLHLNRSLEHQVSVRTASLERRQQLLERLEVVQRSISRRQPLGNIMDAITEGAAHLFGDEVAGLCMFDAEAPDSLRLVSAFGLDEGTWDRMRHFSPEYGLTGRAVREGALVVEEDYVHSQQPLRVLVERGIVASMATPVFRDGRIEGSLVVGSVRAGRKYSGAEQRTLLAFAEHVSIALNDASALQALHLAAEMAEQRATHDELTGLPNRVLLLDRIDQALARAGRSGAAPVVLFVDLDRFKGVNDAMGHACGDQLLVEVAHRLAGAARAGDTVGRLGGDEFVIMSEGLDPSEALDLARRLHMVVAEPMVLGKKTTHITATIGLAFGHPGSSADDVIRDADMAMYRAKQQGRGRVEVFDEVLRQRAVQRIELEEALRLAVPRDELRLLYQPIVDLHSGAVVGAEALIRWQHPERGLLEPGAFIEVAEDSGSIVSLGAWVLNEAAAQAARWVGAVADDRFRMHVNLSARQFGDAHLVECVVAALGATGLSANRLGLEITETVVMDDAPASGEALRTLRKLGIYLSIDDFGTGYSSLSLLKRFSLDALKIDRSFVSGLGLDDDDEAIVGAVVALGSKLGLEVVAEGIEEKLQRDVARALGCALGQGFLFGRPVDGDRFASLHLSRPSRDMVPAITGTMSRERSVRR